MFKKRVLALSSVTYNLVYSYICSVFRTLWHCPATIYLFTLYDC